MSKSNTNTPLGNPAPLQPSALGNLDDYKQLYVVHSWHTEPTTNALHWMSEFLVPNITAMSLTATGICANCLVIKKRPRFIEPRNVSILQVIPTALVVTCPTLGRLDQFRKIAEALNAGNFEMAVKLRLVLPLLEFFDTNLGFISGTVYGEFFSSGCEKFKSIFD